MKCIKCNKKIELKLKAELTDKEIKHDWESLKRNLWVKKHPQCYNTK